MISEEVRKVCRIKKPGLARFMIGISTAYERLKSPTNSYVSNKIISKFIT